MSKQLLTKSCKKNSGGCVSFVKFSLEFIICVHPQTDVKTSKTFTLISGISAGLRTTRMRPQPHLSGKRDFVDAFFEQTSSNNTTDNRFMTPYVPVINLPSRYVRMLVLLSLQGNDRAAQYFLRSQVCIISIEKKNENCLKFYKRKKQSTFLYIFPGQKNQTINELEILQERK